MSVLFSFPEQKPLAEKLYGETIKPGLWEWRHFPDKESYVRLTSNVKNGPVIILCSLNNPDEKFLPLAFLAETLKELGASKITLVAPYLGYMRQDKRFKDGEAVTSTLFARQLSPFIDRIVTIDPHLHRRKNLEEIYSCACTVLSAETLMATWIKSTLPNPLLVGPDMESEQWVKTVAQEVKAPYIILEKTRRDDHEVDIHLPDISRYKGLKPLLLDDIISTGTTMIKTIGLIRQSGFSDISCLATHAVFAENAYENLQRSGAKIIATTNTIPHASNALEISSLLKDCLA